MGQGSRKQGWWGLQGLSKGELTRPRGGGRLLTPDGRRCRGAGGCCSPMVGVAAVGEEGSGWCLQGFRIAREAVEKGGCILDARERRRGVEDRPLTLSRKPTQPDGGNCCYPRVHREHRQAETFCAKDRDPSTVALLDPVWSDACRWWSVVWAGSTETGTRRLFGNTSGWRSARRDRQARLGGNEGGRSRGAPWKPVALERGGAAEFCRVGKGPERGR